MHIVVQKTYFELYIYSSANKCLLSVAKYCAQLEQYEKAIDIYEQVKNAFFFLLISLKNNLLCFKLLIILSALKILLCFINSFRGCRHFIGDRKFIYIAAQLYNFVIFFSVR